MERQIVLATKEKFFSRKEVKKEIFVINKMLPYVESFKAFCDSHEVLDSDKRRAITNHNKLSEIYKHGINSNAFIYVVGKN